MFNNFHLAAIVRRSARTQLLHIPLHRELQDALAHSWLDQFGQFVENIYEVAFDPGYRPEVSERFVLTGYEPPAWLAEEDSRSVADLEEITAIETAIWFVKGTVGFARHPDGYEVMLFQNFTRSKVIKPGQFLFFERNTYRSTQRIGLTLDDKLSAVYLPSERRLLFSSFRTANTFLPLAEFYREASEQEIRQVLMHERLVVDDADALAVDAPQWFRKRFAMLRDSRLLDSFSAREIAEESRKHGVSIEVRNGSIVVPTDRVAAKKLLQYLNEELFRGAITDRLFQTNSKRKAD